MSTQTPPEISAPSKQGNKAKKSFFAGACAKCKNRNGCKHPCFFVEEYLKFENQQPYEIEAKNDEGELLTILFPRSRKEVREADLDRFEGTDKLTGSGQLAFSTNAESPFVCFEKPKLKQTGIFIDRFFYKMSYSELSEKYDIQVSGVAKLYVNAKDRLIKTVAAMDRIEFAQNTGKPLVKTSRAVQAFLLHIGMGLSVSEISRLMGVNHSLVVRQLAKTRDQFITGEIELFTFSTEEKAAAQERLDKLRAKSCDYDKNRKRAPRPKKVCNACQ